MKGKIYSGVTADYSTRIYVAVTTDMVEEARKRHQATPLATEALGRTLTAASIMGQMMKNKNDRLSLQFKGDGILNGTMAVANREGNVKAYVGNPDAVLPVGSARQMDVGQAMGAGQVVVIRDFGMKDPFVGQSDLVTGAIAEDLAHYYMKSEQQPSVVSLSVAFDAEKGQVSAAGGVIIQPLPGASNEVLDKIETSIRVLLPVAQLLNEGMTGPEIAEMALNQFEVLMTEEKTVAYQCDCSRDRIRNALASVGVNELKAMLKEDGQAELHCHFCNTYYQFDEKDLEELIDELSLKK